ncbi:MAG: family 78 glycoside hydrolase catalytic domain, partial [Candidatus Methanomethylophilaceae archaeon]|nr:family 78 glycoside hydrolase catalytic domain [Candidatus Methanomethylophilaceae archaeon]
MANRLLVDATNSFAARRTGFCRQTAGGLSGSRENDTISPMKKQSVLLAAGLWFAGRVLVCGAAVSPRVAALPEAAWEQSEWISVADAKVASPADQKAQRAADGTAVFWRRAVNSREIRSVTWMTAGLGVYELYVNGVRVGEDFLKPGFTHVRKTRRSFTYDVTALVNRAAGASNDFGVEVGAGWWRDKIVAYTGRKSAFRGVFEVVYADGTRAFVGTRAGEWNGSARSPVAHSGIFDGEEFDARVQSPARTPAAFAAFAPGGCEANGEFKGAILPTGGAEICLRRDLAMERGPYSLKKGETLVVDFGQNCAAVPLFRFRAKAGTVLTALPGEMLNDADKGARGCDGPKGSVYRANL